MALEYDTIKDYSYNAFTDTCTNIPIGYAGCPCEVRAIPAASPYIVCLYHAPVQNVPSFTDIYIGVTQLTEVAKTQCPANNQYRVNYDEKGRGQVEFHSNQADCFACICYCHVGTLISKDALDARLNVYCGVNCALCAFASNDYAFYACANRYNSIYAVAGCNIGIYGCAICNCGIVGHATNYGIVGCANTNIGGYFYAGGNIGALGEAICYAGKFTASCMYGVCAIGACGYGGCFHSCLNYGIKTTAVGCYGIRAEASCLGGSFSALEYGIHVTGTYCCAGYFFTEGNYGIYVLTEGNCGIFSCTCGHNAICSISLGCYGVNATAVSCFGVRGQAACYGVRGCGTTDLAVSGNTAYDVSSSRYIKTNKEDISILDCFEKNPNWKVQKWQYTDDNIKGFSCFIGPYAEDLQCVFGLTFWNDHMYSVDGIALGATIELYHRLVLLENKIKKMEANYGN